MINNYMNKFDTISKDLFDKIRGRFENVTIGDKNGQVTNVPEEARYFDFEYISENVPLGKVSVSIDPVEGLTVIVSRDFVDNQLESTQAGWYNFLKELRMFSKKRMMKFDVRDINKANLTKKDYNYLSTNRNEENPMAESKMYGTNKTSFQKIDNARLAIKHSAPIGEGESRLKNISSIFIETPEGEKFKYPVKHLQGARAMAVHVSEGGHAFDDFGQYITSLSEELAKLGKFKTYMSRKSVMAETLSEYMDIVNTRVKNVKKEISNLQKPAYYAEAFANFVAPVMEQVPTDVEEAWIDQLTVKQFNEELKDVFPYIYNLVGESMVEELGPEDLDESGLQYYTGVKKHGKEYMKKAAQAGREGASQEELGRLKDKYSKAEKTKEELELEAAFEGLMGQFAEQSTNESNVKAIIDMIANADNPSQMVMDLVNKGGPVGDFLYNELEQLAVEAGKTFNNAESEPEEFVDELLANMGIEEGNAYAHAVRQAKMNGKKKGDKIDHPDSDEDDITLEKEKTPIGEFILSYFDRENGTFPKGETAVLTMVEKDYGEQYVEPAARFMQKAEAMCASRRKKKTMDSRYPETERVKALAGLS